MEIFKGWYRKSFSRKNSVWHRAISATEIMNYPQTVTTLCGREFKTTCCDFKMNSDHSCRECEKLKCHQNIRIDTKFAPIGRLNILTRADAIHELKRLLKTRIYFVRIWDIYGIEIRAAWESDSSIDIGITNFILRNETRTVTLDQVQEDLGTFKSSIDHLIESATKLAKEQKINDGLKGCLTICEDNEYFEELLEKAKMGIKCKNKRKSLSK